MRADEWRERRALLAGRLEEWKLDALLVTHPPNVRYLTGFTGSNGMLLLHDRGAILFTDPRYRVQAGREVSCRVKVAKGSLLTDVMAAVARLKTWRLGFERSHVKFETYDFLKSRLPMKASLEPVAGRIEQQRMIKSAAEIAAIRASVATNSKAFEQAVRRARPGMRESELAAEIEHRMRRLGAEKPAFDTIVAAGPNSALPHASPGNAPLKGLVVVDMGAMQNGYTSDMTRMLFAGRPGRKEKQLYEAVLEAQLAALEAVRAGVPAGAVDRAARRVLGRHKFAARFRAFHRAWPRPRNPRGPAPGQDGEPGTGGKHGGYGGAGRLSRGLRRCPHRRHSSSYRHRLRDPDADEQGVASNLALSGCRPRPANLYLCHDR